jgi:hypothetical protein
MQRIGLVIMVMLFPLLLACGSQEEPAKGKPPVTGEQVKKQAEKALETTGAYLQQQQADYEKQIGAQLDALQQKIQELRARAEKAAPELKARLQEQIDELQKQEDAAQKKLAVLRAASGKAWEDFKAGMDQAVADLLKSYEKARAQFK